MTTREAITGTAAGVPFVALPPNDVERRSTAPAVVVWHMLDAPRTESAFAAALPLDGLDVWRIYLGLPLSGSRLPAGGLDGLMRLGYEDAVLNIQGPITDQAADEFEGAFGEIRERLGIADAPIGVVGGSAGAAVALLVMAETSADVRSAVLVSPLLRLTSAVTAMERVFGVTYTWSDRSRAIASRLDFVARAEEIAARQPSASVLLVVGADDDVDGFRAPATELRGALDRYLAGSAELVTVPGMAHALAEEPGIEPAPQTSHAALVDEHAARWFRRHLLGV